MTDTTCPSTPAPSLRAWWNRLAGIGAALRRRGAVNHIDLDTAPADLLRDIGLCDGRGPSLRRPERLG